MVQDRSPSEHCGDVLPPITPDETREVVTLKLATPKSSDKDGLPTYHRRTLKVVRDRRNVPYQREEFEREENFHVSDTDLMRKPSDEVMYGSPHSIIDNMPSMTRMLIEDQAFFCGSNCLFKMVSPETQARSYIKTSDSVLEGYEFANGGGIDQEDMDEWQYGGQSPAILAFVRDLLPSHQCDEAHVAILEHGTGQTFTVPQGQDHQFLVLSGQGYIRTESNNSSREREVGVSQKMLVEGPAAVDIRDMGDGLIVVIGKTILDAETNDMLDQAMATGYVDIYEMYDSCGNPDISDEDTESTPVEERGSLLPGRMYETHVPEGLIPDLNALDSDIPQDTAEMETLWKKETAGKIPVLEWRARRKYRKLLDMLSLSYDSPYAGRGFKAPGIRWQRIVQETPSINSYIADQRKLFFEGLHAQAKAVNSFRTLYGSKVWTCSSCKAKNEEGGHICSDCGKKFANKSGFYGKIREKNAQDRDIALKWSEKPQKTRVRGPNGEDTWITSPSAFEKARNDFIEKLQKKDYPEDTIKRMLWHWFDRVGGKKEAVYEYRLHCKCGTKFLKRTTVNRLSEVCCPTCQFQGKPSILSAKIAKGRNGIKLTSKTVEDSIWRQKRSLAWQELNCTKPQWNTIYNQLEIQKRRIRMGDRLTQDRRDAYEVLGALFRDCSNHEELEQFKETAYRQQIDEDGKITHPSLMDRISFGDEKRIMFAWRRQWLALKEPKEMRELRLREISEHQEKLARARWEKIQ